MKQGIKEKWERILDQDKGKEIVYDRDVLIEMLNDFNTLTPAPTVTDEEIQKYIKDNLHHYDGTPMVDVQAFYEGAKWLRDSQPSEREIKRYRCKLCGRDKFTRKTAHQCVGGYRKHGIEWELINERLNKKEE